MIVTHADLEHYHYEALNNPAYAAECIAELKFEEAMMNMPILLEPVEAQAEPQWTAPQWDIINQLRGQVNFLQNKINEHLDRYKGQYTIQ